jgi:hypothetical protein
MKLTGKTRRAPKPLTIAVDGDLLFTGILAMQDKEVVPILI